MKYDIKKILQELNSIPAFDKNRKQFILQGVKGQEDKSYGEGGLEFLKPEHKEHMFVYPLYDIPYINDIMSEQGMYRTRVMSMRPKSCYTLHYDCTKRIHIPLQGELDQCFMLVDNEIVWMKDAGKVYTIDTTKTHTAVNASRKFRMHIVGVI